MSIPRPRYVVNAMGDTADLVFTAGSQGLWLVDVGFQTAGASINVCRVADMSDDGVPVVIVPLREGDPDALSTCVSNPTDLTPSVFLAQFISPPSLQFKRFYPIYVAPSSTLFVSVGAGNAAYLSEG